MRGDDRRRSDRGCLRAGGAERGNDHQHSERDRPEDEAVRTGDQRAHRARHIAAALALLTAGLILWIIYGLLKSDWVIVVANGVGLEPWLNDAVDSSGFSGRRVDASAGLTLRHKDGGDDPHVWQDPRNAEQMVDPSTGQPHTAHTSNPVPFHLIGEGLTGVSLREGGALEDVAPTMLALLGIEKPAEMTGRDLQES